MKYMKKEKIAGVIEKIDNKITEFINEEDRKKKEVIGKQISNLCITNFKLIAEYNHKMAEIAQPLIALGYYRADDNMFDPNITKLKEIMNKLKGMIRK